MLIVWWSFLLIAGVLQNASPGPACRISEFPCRNGRCVRLNAYCDGLDDCGDLSDEPPYCTVCNRTYYGDVSKTYDLKVLKQPDNRLPFLCHLTFTANGQSHGDIVQLMFDEFKVGRYEASALDGCPDGYMQLSELGRPFTGGSWCGSSSGPAAYYSETSTVTVSIKLFQNPQQPFQFRLRYRFVSRREAVVRFGSPSAPLERGQVAPGTYCTRQFEECYRKPCRLQSPNYPGMYPRNVSCYWSLRQKIVPTCKHAMIAVRQEAAHKMHMKRSISVAGLNKTARALRAWRDCTGERDHLIFYDGGSTNDPVLAKYCGGDWLPRVVSRGPEMLVAFHSSPFSIPLHSPPSHSPLRGFELDVDVIFADSDSLDYSRDSLRCDFDVNATNQDGDEIWSGRGRRGSLISPRHSLPPNTTCTYKFRGHLGDLVWISFVSYSQRALLVGENAQALIGNSSTGGTCATRLRIWDGALLLEDKCDDSPKLCDHSALSNSTRITRPCTTSESYLSTGRALIIQHHTEDGTALHPASFKLKYEFIDTRLGGEPWPGKEQPGPCHRIFKNMRHGEINGPRNTFLFGRGGAKDLHCVYRIEAGVDERVRLVLNNASFGISPSCESVSDAHTGRPSCEYLPGGRVAELSVWELPWRDIRVPKACLCDNSSLSNRPMSLLSSSRTLELHFTTKDMNISEDFTLLHFHATFEIVSMPECPRKQRVRGYGGDVQFASPPIDRSELLCSGMPWLVESRFNRSLFLLSWGAFLPLRPRPEEPSRCPTTNRILVYSGKPPKLVRAICPTTPGDRHLAVHVFSEEWWGEDSIHYVQKPPNFLVEWISHEQGVAAFSWLEISRSRSSLLQQLQVPINASANDTEFECMHKCPELDACISPELWCDGKDHCPSGWDESEAQCGATSRLLTSLPAAALAVAGAVAASLVLLICLSLHRLRARRRRRLAKKKLLTGPRLLDPGLNS
ncbi:PREDICTED: uncharacterized protein LOC108558152 [Nicrophorus vespilloides]|uniref:Uncharacterized protein LOC108558152 n=1 Tax=Nicrophorus vespilloides TaxID=110193 RepID=A0ABM1M7B3_NICVS|nr:PREDICTED: uncharacterized protein LOC108558152 [Nicrophorus vespilloides]